MDTSGCEGFCGDDLRQAPYEKCDGTDLAEHSCTTQGFFTGILACDLSCEPDTSGCRNLAEIAAGLNHTCALLNDGTVRCWGYNYYGQLGDGSTTNRLTPTAVTGISTAVKVTAGDNHTCALLSDGTARCWGRNGYGQLGDNSTTNRTTPQTVGTLANGTVISAGGEHTCAVKADRTIWCWGRNSNGQLGNDTTTNALIPSIVSP